jgi:hypothetical protein
MSRSFIFLGITYYSDRGMFRLHFFLSARFETCPNSMNSELLRISEIKHKTKNRHSSSTTKLSSRYTRDTKNLKKLNCVDVGAAIRLLCVALVVTIFLDDVGCFEAGHQRPLEPVGSNPASELPGSDRIRVRVPAQSDASHGPVRCASRFNQVPARV